VKLGALSFAEETMADQQPILFEDMFEVQQVDPDGKKFDRGGCPGCPCSVSAVIASLTV
jgi:hypothetical protein